MRRMEKCWEAALSPDMLIVFTGNGKGKTTASLGQALRAVGQGKRALMIQFIKGPWKSGEDESHKRLAPDFEIRKMGLGFVGILGDSLPRARHEEAAEKAMRSFERELASKKWNTIVLDEVNVAVSLKLVSAARVLRAVKKSPLETFVIMTGRNAPKSFLRSADLVTEMREVKHPFAKGELAKIALDF